MIRRPPRSTLFPYTRSSDLVADRFYDRAVAVGEVRPGYELWRPNREKASSVSTKFVVVLLLAATAVMAAQDRKSTRLNSSHMSISYAVFCLKKKKKFLYYIS